MFQSAPAPEPTDSQTASPPPHLPEDTFGDTTEPKGKGKGKSTSATTSGTTSTTTGTTTADETTEHFARYLIAASLEIHQCLQADFRRQVSTIVKLIK